MTSADPVSSLLSATSRSVGPPDGLLPGTSPSADLNGEEFSRRFDDVANEAPVSGPRAPKAPSKKNPAVLQIPSASVRRATIANADPVRTPRKLDGMKDGGRDGATSDASPQPMLAAIRDGAVDYERGESQARPHAKRLAVTPHRRAAPDTEPEATLVVAPIPDPHTQKGRLEGTDSNSGDADGLLTLRSRSNSGELSLKSAHGPPIQVDAGLAQEDDAVGKTAIDAHVQSDERPDFRKRIGAATVSRVERPSQTGIALASLPGDSVAPLQAATIVGSSTESVRFVTALSEAGGMPARQDPASDFAANTDRLVASIVHRGVDSKVEVVLDPPELGRVLIEFEGDAERVLRIIVTAEAPETQSLLRRNIDAFHASLGQQGVVGVDVELRDRGPQDGRNDARPDNERNDGVNGDESPSDLDAEERRIGRYVLENRLDRRL